MSWALPFPALVSPRGTTPVPSSKQPESHHCSPRALDPLGPQCLQLGLGVLVGPWPSAVSHWIFSNDTSAWEPSGPRISALRHGQAHTMLSHHQTFPCLSEMLGAGSDGHSWSCHPLSCSCLRLHSLSWCRTGIPACNATHVAG